VGRGPRCPLSEWKNQYSPLRNACCGEQQQEAEDLQNEGEGLRGWGEAFEAVRGCLELIGAGRQVSDWLAVSPSARILEWYFEFLEIPWKRFHAFHLFNKEQYFRTNALLSALSVVAYIVQVLKFLNSEIKILFKNWTKN
jgi:hypothetical protein